MQLLRELTHLSHDEDAASILHGFVLTDEQQLVEVGALRLKIVNGDGKRQMALLEISGTLT